MVAGLRRNAVVERKLREETQVREWLAAAPERHARWGTVLDEMLALDEQEAAAIERDMAVGFAMFLLQDAPLLAALVDACSAAAADGGSASSRPQEALAREQLAADLDLVQVPVLGIVLDEFRSLPAGQRLRGTGHLQDRELPGQGGPELARALLQRSQMGRADARAELFGQGAAAVAASDDPLVVLARGLAAERDDYLRRRNERDGRMLTAGRRWIEVQEAFRGRDFYPDANGTLRVSIASVKGYAPRDGLRCVPNTTVGGILEKERGVEPFASPAALLAAADKRRESRWFDAQLGDVPVCFLTDGDTTGGNSGSPVVNGRGELIGLNFDRVFEAVAGDFGWNPDRSRNVCCDLRYVLWVVESVLPSPSLLAELGVRAER
jgi:hypothetical protein